MSKLIFQVKFKIQKMTVPNQKIATHLTGNQETKVNYSLLIRRQRIFKKKKKKLPITMTEVL